MSQKLSYLPVGRFADPIRAIADTPILRGKTRKYYEYQFPAITLAANQYNSETLRTPGNAWFLCRQILYTVQLTNQPANLGIARISSSSEHRENFAWGNELVNLALFASTNSRTPHFLYKPNLIEPNTSLTLEVENIDTSQHIYHVTLVGELIFDLTRDEINHLMSYAWFGYSATFTPSSNSSDPNVPASRSEIRTHPDSDFYITHFSSQRFGPSNVAATGPTRTKIIQASLGNPIMDNPINNSLLFGSYYNMTVVPVTTIGPTPLPYPIKVPANSSLLLQAMQADLSSAADAETVFLEGIKVFK